MADMIESMIPTKALLEYLEAERKDWEGVNADRYYQTSRIIGFVKVLVSHRQGISENARLHNEANDSERSKDQYEKCESFSDVCKTFMEVDPQMKKFFGKGADQ